MRTAGRFSPVPHPRSLCAGTSAPGRLGRFQRSAVYREVRADQGVSLRLEQLRNFTNENRGVSERVLAWVWAAGHRRGRPGRGTRWPFWECCSRTPRPWTRRRWGRWHTGRDPDSCSVQEEVPGQDERWKKRVGTRLRVSALSCVGSFRKDKKPLAGVCRPHPSPSLPSEGSLSSCLPRNRTQLSAVRGSQ